MRQAEVHISERIWELWREELEDVGDEWRLGLLLAAAGDPVEWDWAGVPEGLAISVTECEDFEVVLPRLAAALARRGIDGAFRLWDAPPAPLWPGSADALIFHVRVRGARVYRGPRSFRWRPASAARARLVAAADRWCRRPGERPACSRSVGIVVAVDAEEDVLARVHEGLDRGTPAIVTARAGERFAASASTRTRAS